jgi:hypothetical protein
MFPGLSDVNQAVAGPSRLQLCAVLGALLSSYLNTSISKMGQNLVVKSVWSPVPVFIETYISAVVKLADMSYRDHEYCLLSE